MRAAKNYNPCGNPTKRSYAALILCLLVSLSLLMGCSEAALETKPTMKTEKSVSEQNSSRKQTVETKVMAAMEEEIVEEEPQPESFVLSFAGDCTLADMIMMGKSYSFFTNTVGDDYSWPFRNVASIFAEDDLTFVNLEGVLGCAGGMVEKEFSFHSKEEYCQCFFEGNIDIVTLANNHTLDFGYDGYYRMLEVLDEYELPYVGDDEIKMYQTASGLRIGFYAACWPKETRLRGALETLSQQEEMDLIICAFHYGQEGYYQPDANQKYLAHLAVDLGADIVYGSHPHVLQPIEQYNDGIIYYSMGNFCFGGNPNPLDYDSVIIQQYVIREVDGTVHLGDTILIPCSVSSVEKSNNYQPTPYVEGTPEYERAMKKLMGEYERYSLPFSY